MTAWIPILLIVGILFAIIHGAYQHGREAADPSLRPPCKRCGHKCYHEERPHGRGPFTKHELSVLRDVPPTFCWGCSECAL